MPHQPDQLTRVENALRKGLRDGAAAFLDDFISRYKHGGLDDGAGATCQTGLTQGLQQAWLTAWMLTGRELAAMIRKRFPARTVRSLVQEPASGGDGQPPRLSLPPPLPLPEDFRTWMETHTPEEGGTSPVPVPRSGAEWLAEHEATVNKWVPREYVDRYVRTRVPPLAHIADEHLKELARDLVAANVERGFGVRETVRSLRRDFPAFAARRLENIARTEGATCYEHGRLARYMADGLVTGVEYSAVGGKQGDGRTTEICKNLHGRKWRLEDPNKVTPPAHYQCRSTLLPVLFNEQPEWETGPVPEDAQPLEGFGTVDPALLPPNVTPEELFGTSTVPTGLPAIDMVAERQKAYNWLRPQLAPTQQKFLETSERQATEAELDAIARMWSERVPVELQRAAASWEEEYGAGIPIRVSIIEGHYTLPSGAQHELHLIAEDLIEVGGHHVVNHEIRHAVLDVATVESAGSEKAVFDAMGEAGVRTPIHANFSGRGSQYHGAREFVNIIADSYESGMTVDAQVSAIVKSPGLQCERVLGSGQRTYGEADYWTRDEATAAIKLWRKWVAID